MFKFSTIDSDSLTWTAATLLDSNGEAIDTSKPRGVNVLTIINGSASDRIFRVAGGAPFLVPTLNSGTYDLRANGISTTTPLIEMDSATFTNITIFGG